MKVAHNGANSCTNRAVKVQTVHWNYNYELRKNEYRSLQMFPNGEGTNEF